MNYKTKLKQFVAGITAMAVMATSGNYATLYATNTGVNSAETSENSHASVSEASTNKTTSEETQITNNKNSQSTTYKAENYQVTTSLNNRWQGGYQATITIKNTGDATIENWQLKFSSDWNIINIWNGEIVSKENGQYSIKNCNYNQDIPRGQSVEIGFIGTGEFTTFPTEYQIISEKIQSNQENYNITYTLENDWGSGFTGNIQIKNLTEKEIEDWVIEFDYNRDIKNLWNGIIIAKEENHYTIKNAGYNSNIPANQTISIGFTGEGGSKEDEPENFELYTYGADKLQQESESESTSEAVTEETESREETIEQTTIEETTTETTTEQTSGQETTKEEDASTQEITTQETTTEEQTTEEMTEETTTKETDNETTRETTEQETTGEVVTEEITTQKITEKEETTQEITTEQETTTENTNEETYCKVTFQLNSNEAQKPATQYVKPGEKAVKPEEPTKTDCLFMGWYTEKTYENYYDFENMTIQQDTTLYARWFNYVDMADTDEDGITDNVEEFLGTDKNKKDTDGDGLSDALEVDELDTDPIRKDTDGDGTNDGDEDADGDGLSNIEELEQGTNMLLEDTDEDGLTDYDEIKTYKTNAIIYDTDEDKVSDGKEIELGTDPLVAQETFRVVQESEEEGKVKASVHMTLAGEQVETLQIEQVHNDTLFSEDIPGYIGEAYDFSVDGTFDTATLCFEFDESLLESSSFDPVVYYFNEEEQELEALETKVEGNVASATVTHFSTYWLIDRKIFEGANMWLDVWQEQATCQATEVVIVVEDSSIMQRRDPEYERVEFAKSIVDNLPDGCKIGIVHSATTPTLLTKKLTTDKKEAKEYLSYDYYWSRGGKSTYETVIKALSLYESEDETTSKFMIVLNEGKGGNPVLSNKTKELAKEKGVKIFCVEFGINETIADNVWGYTVSGTGGISFVLERDDIEEVRNQLNNYINIELDSDDDGIPDYYEDNMMMFNRLPLEMDKYNQDTDYDGLPDGEEVVYLKFNYGDANAKAVVIGKIKTNPCSDDTDGDGLCDGTSISVGGRTIAPKDPEPLEYNGLEGMWKKHIEYHKWENPVGTSYSDETGNDLLVDSGIATSQVKIILKLKERLLDDVDEKLTFSVMARLIKEYAKGEDAEKIGAYLLNFIHDNEGIAYHSQVDTWQRAYGYNDFYDDVFRIASNMNMDNFDFSVGNETYALWLWKGDYWNLNSGAEFGLYKQAEEYSDIMHYEAVDFELPMTLSLYNYYTSEDIKNVFSWMPDEKQWWITGFNPEFDEPNPDNMVVVGSIDFSGREELYEELKDAKNTYGTRKKEVFEKTFVFDDDKCIVWMLW